MQLPLRILSDFARGGWPRPDQAHVALQHVPQLRPLVNTPAAHERAQPRAPRVISHLEDWALGLVVLEQRTELFIRVRPHRAEFQHREFNAAAADPSLAEQWRAAAILEPDQKRQEHEEPRQHHEHRERDQHVDRALGEEIQAFDGGILHADQRDAADRVHVQAAQADLIQVGDEPELHTVSSAVIDDAHDGLVRRARQGDHDLRDPFLVDHPLELVGSPQSTESSKVGFAIGCQEACHHEAEVRPTGQGLHDHAPDRVVAHDERALDAKAALVQHSKDPQPVGAAEHDEQRDQRPGKDERQPRLGGVTDEGGAREQDHQREPGNREDGRQVVQRTCGAWESIQPAHRQDADEHHRE